jgi:hypothetical protein
MCEHQPRCPDALAPDHQAARAIATHPEQGWSLLCNGIVLFDDDGELLLNGRAADGGTTDGQATSPVSRWVVAVAA